ncbi:MAG: DNA alkylation repair protein [Firmicutes bacterium]|nr:DNA alkylation repair protein [Bacillota bacterium]
MNYKKEILEFLDKNQDIAYRDFNQRIIQTNYPMYGVRAPILKKKAKELAKEGASDFLSYQNYQSHEELIIYAYMLGYLSITFQELTIKINQLIPYIDNWAVNDSACSSLTQFKKHQKEGYEYILSLLKKKDTYSIRMGLVLLLDHYINDDYIERVLELCNHDYSDEYYVKMAHSWLISICYIKYPEKTKGFLKDTQIDNWTYNKAISKICDSRQIAKEEKEQLKLMKK